MSVRSRWLRAPALHFAAIGALLFALAAARESALPEPPVEREPIVVGAAQIEQLLARYERSTGLRVRADDAQALVDRHVADEILVREALMHGLDREDRGVQWRLIEKMTFLSEHEGADDADLLDQAVGLGLSDADPIVRRILLEKMRLALEHAGSLAAPTDAELTAYLERHRERFVQPARVRISHVVLLAERRPGTLEADAARLAQELRRDAVSPESAVARGDPFPMPNLSWSLAEPELATRFGRSFADGVAKLEPGAWSEPLASPLGLHLVWVHERVSERMPTLDEARGRVLYGLLAERRAQAFDEGLRALRAQYDVRVEWPAWVASAAAGATHR